MRMVDVHVWYSIAVNVFIITIYVGVDEMLNLSEGKVGIKKVIPGYGHDRLGGAAE